MRDWVDTKFFYGKLDNILNHNTSRWYMTLRSDWHGAAVLQRGESNMDVWIRVSAIFSLPMKADDFLVIFPSLDIVLIGERFHLPRAGLPIISNESDSLDKV